jgi:acetolactate synthase-1/2/3 large subunit
MGALGYAVPGVVGVAAADPKRCSIALAGDGSLGFSCGELETIARLGWNIKVFLFKNNSFGWIRGETALVHEFEPFATEFGSVDYSKIAEGFGLKAFEVKAPGELSGVLESAFSMKGPAFVTVNVLPEDKLVPPIPRWVKSGKRKGLPCIY